MTHEQRRELKAFFDQRKRRQIAEAHGRTLTGIRHIAECEHCGGIIDASRRFCDQACINAARETAA